jgi:hypothetical protein
MEKEAKKNAKAASLREKISELMKSKETLTTKQLDVKMAVDSRNIYIMRQSGKQSRPMRSA